MQRQHSQMGDVEDDGPYLPLMAVLRDEVEVDAVEEQRERLNVVSWRFVY